MFRKKSVLPEVDMLALETVTLSIWSGPGNVSSLNMKLLSPLPLRIGEIAKFEIIGIERTLKEGQ